MKNIYQDKTAYGGLGFKKRIRQLNDECFHSEFAPLKKVLIYIPGNELLKIKKPNSVQHLAQINPNKIKKEFNLLINFLKKEKIDVSIIKSKIAPPNLMFCRDIFWNSPYGIIISRMGSLIREPEEKIAIEHLSKSHQFYYHFKHNEIFEGADVLWINKNTLILGIGNRTNKNAFKTLTLLLPNITIIPIKLPKKVQHLLGMINLIDKKTVLLRHQIAPKKLKSLLKAMNYKIINIPEIDEVVHYQGMNIVVIRPKQIIMPDDCPILEKLYLQNNIKILQKFNITEARKAAGGLACIVGILKRQS